MTENPNEGAELPGAPGAHASAHSHYTSAQGGAPSPDGSGQPRPFQPNGRRRTSVRLDPWTLLELLGQRWHWLLIGMCASAGLFYLLGLFVVKPKFTASGQLLRYETPGKSEAFKTTPISGDTFAQLIRSPELLQRVGSQMVPAIPPETLAKCVKVDADPDTDYVKVQVAARAPQYAVDLLNLYLTNAVAYTRALEAKQAALLANDYLKIQVTQMDNDISSVEHQLMGMPAGAGLTNHLALAGNHIQQLNRAVTELNDLLLNFTERHPKVQAKKAQIKELEAQIAADSTNTDAAAVAPFLAAPLQKTTGGGATPDPELDIVHIRLKALEDGRLELLKRAREAELYANDPPPSVRIFSVGDLKNVKTNMRGVKVGLVTVFGGGVGLGFSLLLVLLVELVDNRLKSADDVGRVTELPVLSTLGDLHAMAPEERTQWAFRTWTMLQGRLSPSPNYGLVCGITSSTPGEGRSTWISLLAEAASLSGFKVLTIATRPSPTHMQEMDDFSDDLLNDADFNHAENGSSTQALTQTVLNSPSQITEQLTGPNPPPIVHIPLPGWVWNLERRKQWREALDHWRRIENLVIFVELPPASVPEAVLLGSNLPNMVWLADSGTALAGKTRTHLETLRNARCNLVGAVLNHEPTVPLKKRFPRWIACLWLLVAFGLSTQAQTTNTNTVPPVAPPPQSPATQAQSNNPAAATISVPVADSAAGTNSVSDTNQPALTAPPSAFSSAPAEHGGSFSIVNPAQRAPWQQHFTLGPGDLLNFGLYDHPELTRTEVPIGPDGRINYLEATNVLATGLTVDELRAKLDDELGQYRRAPHTLITPVAFHSKKYYMLGKVMTKGVYTLDRPLTVLEALARAHGLESALIDRNVVSLTDFSRSFLSRGGKRLPLNFERLFQQGDLSQNIAVEPGDYIYFASADVNEVYVVGEVRLPGPVTYRPDLTLIGAITERGGFTERAWRARVLVVRGSLSNPEAIAVNTHAALDAKEPDFKLRPKDIIYVNSRPFIKVEEAADLAATAFIQSVITSWVGVDVVKPF